MCKDVFVLISTYIHPKNGHTFREWNSFTRLNKITASIGRDQKEIRSKMFGISLDPDLRKLQKQLAIKEKKFQAKNNSKFRVLEAKWKLNASIPIVLADGCLKAIVKFKGTKDVLESFIKEKNKEIKGKNPNVIISVAHKTMDMMVSGKSYTVSEIWIMNCEKYKKLLFRTLSKRAGHRGKSFIVNKDYRLTNDPKMDLLTEFSPMLQHLYTIRTTHNGNSIIYTKK